MMMRLQEVDKQDDLKIGTLFHQPLVGMKRGFSILLISALCFTITACDFSSEERQQYFAWASDQKTTWQEQPMHEQEYRACNSTNKSCQVITDLPTLRKGVSYEH